MVVIRNFCFPRRPLVVIDAHSLEPQAFWLLALGFGLAGHCHWNCIGMRNVLQAAYLLAFLDGGDP
jgi:hypothetical protein